MPRISRFAGIKPTPFPFDACREDKPKKPPPIIPLTQEELEADARERFYKKMMRGLKKGKLPRPMFEKRAPVNSRPEEFKIPHSLREIYEILHVSVDNLFLDTVALCITDEMIKRAFHKRSLETHPDRGGCEDEFKRVVWAYNLTSTEKRRAQILVSVPAYPMVPADLE